MRGRGSPAALPDRTSVGSIPGGPEMSWLEEGIAVRESAPGCPSCLSHRQCSPRPRSSRGPLAAHFGLTEPCRPYGPYASSRQPSGHPASDGQVRFPCTSARCFKVYCLVLFPVTLGQLPSDVFRRPLSPHLWPTD